jgi:predicted nucleic acid-binding protein/predicted transcriptional regulator
MAGSDSEGERGRKTPDLPGSAFLLKELEKQISTSCQSHNFCLIIDSIVKRRPQWLVCEDYMDTQILKRYQDVKPYIACAQKCADSHRNELGFLTPTAYEEQALQNRLWVCIDKEQNKYLGHLLFGGKYPYLKIFQLVVLPEYRKEMIPYSLLIELEDFGVENSYLNITARVAEDLAANKLWDFFGFKLIRQVEGGRARSRTINLRSKELETRSLLSLIELHTKQDSSLIKYSHQPVFTSNLYVIDVNVLLDVTRNRHHKQQASAIIRAGLNNDIRVAVTEEFVAELKRSNAGRASDPLLELAYELPRIPVDKKSVLEKIIEELREIVFRGRSVSRKCATQDTSDLVHIATCVFAKVDGFITREKAILRAKDELFSKYNLEVLSPSDIEEVNYTHKTSIHVGSINSSNSDLHINTIKDTDLSKLNKYLSPLRLKQTEIDALYNKGTTGSLRHRVYITHDSLVIGVASWDVPSSLIKEVSAYLLISEDNPVAERAIDHIIESIIRDNNSDVRVITLSFSQEQTKTRSTALARGFRFGSNSKDSILAAMVKMSFSGLITYENWENFVNKFKSLTKFSLPTQMPDFTNIDAKCLRLYDEANDNEILLSYFDLETLISPAILLPKNRSSILLPIKPVHADELGICTPSQRSLLSKQEAFLHVEKAYFRKNKNIKVYERGMLLFFYISSKGEYSQTVVGCARTTYTDANSIDVITERFHRQGVLHPKALISLVDRQKRIHVITFDNFYNFQNPITLSTLKANNHISKTNLVSGEPQDHAQTQAILKYALNVKGH